MAKIISFSWTAPALFAEDLALRKTETRRQWTDRYAKRFRKDEMVQAYDRSPRYGGRRIALLRLTRAPYQERLRDVPGNAWYREGFEYLQQIGAKVNKHSPMVLWRSWRMSDEVMWVVEFELVEDCREATIPASVPVEQPSLF